jgi:2'-5' RNA ligase
MSGAASSRLFLALWPEPEVRDKLRAWRDGWQWPPSAAPVRGEQLHLTLHFLGAVARERVPQLTHGLALPFEPFELAFGHAELWPHGIALLAPDAIPTALSELHAALGGALRKLGMTPETRPFRPHVTLARRAAVATPPSQGPALRWAVRDYALMLSETGADGGYTVLQRYRADNGA